jgi:hypothetical protein
MLAQPREAPCVPNPPAEGGVETADAPWQAFMRTEGCMRRVVTLGFAFVMASVGACGNSDSGTGIKASSPTGTINGQPWSFVEANATDDGDALFVVMFAETVPSCAMSSSSDMPIVMFTMPATVGQRQLRLDLFDFNSSNNQFVTFYVPATNMNEISTEGWLDLSALTDSSATIGINATFEGDAVNGTFTATICP